MRQIAMLLAAAFVMITLVPTIERAGADTPSIGLGPGASVSGEISAVGETDTYQLHTSAGSIYVIETFAVGRGSGEGTLLSVYNTDGRRIAWGSPGAGDADRTLEITAPTDGPLELRVTGRGSWAGAYHLRALATTGEPGAAWDDHGEPDGWCSLARPLGVSEEARGDIAPADPATISWYPDGDSYVIDLAGGRSYAITVGGLSADAPEGAVLLVISEQETGIMIGWAQSGGGVGAAQVTVSPRVNTRYCVTVSGREAMPWAGGYRVSTAELTRVLIPLVSR
jgi:hypothetical protein